MMQFSRLIPLVLCTVLLAACSPSKKEIEKEKWWQSYYGNNKSENMLCTMYGNCPGNDSDDEESALCSFYGNCPK